MTDDRPTEGQARKDSALAGQSERQPSKQQPSDIQDTAVMTDTPVTPPPPDLAKRTLPPPDNKGKDNAHRVKHTFTAPLLVLLVYILLLLTRGVDYTAAGTPTETYLSLVAVQLLVFMLPSVFYIRFRQTDVREELRLRLPTPDKIMFIVLCSLILIISSVLIGAAQGDYGRSVYSSDRIFSGVGKTDGVDVFIYYAICFALVPAISEEMLFRGIIMSEYQRTSVFSAVVINSLFFAMLHFDLSNFPFYFISGLILSMCAYAANSIVASAIAHLGYNLFSIFGGELVTKVVKTVGDMKMITLALCALLLLILALTFGECERIYSSYAKKNRDSFYVVKHKRGEGALRFFAALFSPVSLVCIVTFIVVILLQK